MLIFSLQNIKKEIEVPYNCIDIDKLDAICEILNKSGAWKNLAELWDCGHAISGAKLSLNPTKCIFEYAEVINLLTIINVFF